MFSQETCLTLLKENMVVEDLFTIHSFQVENITESTTQIPSTTAPPFIFYGFTVSAETDIRTGIDLNGKITYTTNVSQSACDYLLHDQINNTCCVAQITQIANVTLSYYTKESLYVN